MKIINKMFRGFNSTSYEITEFVNFGGMSQIYRAISKDDSKLVIIKLLTFSKTESPQKVRQRLAIEGIVSSKLNHPGICKTLDYVYDDEGNYGLVLENLIGNNLSEIINRLRTPFSLKETLVVIFEICEALKYAHNSNNELKNKIFHRDLKPSNIFITDEMQVKLLDFGISCELDDKWQSIQLNSGFTKCYTPPDLWKDQSTFNHNSYTEAHDVYCLGLIFYELLTKKKAFKNLKQNQQGIIECISEHGFIDEDIISTFRKWTHLNPNERFQNIEELTNALREIKITHYDNSNIITIASFEDNDKTQQDYTEIDNTLFTNTVHNLTTIEEVVSLNILLSLQKKIHSSEIRNEIIETTKRIAKTINQTHLNYQKIDYTSFSIRALSITHGNLLKEIVPTLIFSQEQHFKDLLKSMKSIITENEAYNIYSQIYKTIQRTNHIDIDLFLNEIRLSFELDPFNCDSEKNCEGFQESLTALLFVKLNLKSLNEAKKFINDSIRIYKIPEESFYTNALFFYSSIKSKIAINTSEYEKQVISLTLSRIAFADKKIDISEKKFLESINSQLNLRSNNYHLLLNKDKKELFISLPQELQAFTLITLFNFIMVGIFLDC